MHNKKLVNTKQMSYGKWLELREKGIGGSDSVAIVGLNAYITLYKLWDDKTGRLPEVEDNEAMQQGRDFEDYVAKRFEEVTRKKVRRQNNMIVHNKHDFIFANIDRQVRIECKTTSVMNLKNLKMEGSRATIMYNVCIICL